MMIGNKKQIDKRSQKSTLIIDIHKYQQINPINSKYLLLPFQLQLHLDVVQGAPPDVL